MRSRSGYGAYGLETRMNKRRKLAIRLAVYLRCAGIEIAAERSESYRDACRRFELAFIALGQGTRNAARLGRRAIQSAGGLEQAGGWLVPRLNSIQVEPRQTRERNWREKLLRKASSWPPDSPACPVCRCWWGMPKRCYPTIETAEAVRCRMPNDPWLRVYPCTAMSGFWHLGHVKRRRKTDPNETREPSM